MQTLLSDLNGKVQAHLSGASAEAPPSAEGSLANIVDAIHSIQLIVEKGEDHDYTESFEQLGKAVVSALEKQGGALVKAISKAAITVEAPQVTVEAPNVEVRPEFELTIPEPTANALRVRVTERDQNEDLLELVIEPVKASDPQKPTSAEPAATFE